MDTRYTTLIILTPHSQLLPYLPGRNNFKIYAAIPHIIDPTNDGTTVNSQWGQGVDVKRIEGRGDGGNNLQLTPEAVAEILNSSTSFLDTLPYSAGFDPVGFQITDPVALKEADFELSFVDTVTNTIGPTTRWFLHDLTNGDTIWSERPLDRPYQQQIVLTENGQNTDYGFSIKLGTPVPVYTLPAGYDSLPRRSTYGVDASQSSIFFIDSLHQWLSFVANSGTKSVTNWIRSGTTAFDPAGNNPEDAGAFDDNWYYTSGSGVPPTYAPGAWMFDDTNSVYANILGGTWAPYCLTPNYNNKSPLTSMGKTQPPYVYGPGFKWYAYNYAATQGAAPPQNTLDQLYSVDVVITPDKTKWSHCIVLETGEDESINEGNALRPRASTNINLANKGAFKGQIRMAYSQDWNSGNPANPDYLVQTTSDTGRSWFPGYAINVETGERLNIAFGESSDLGGQNGRDMLWDPTSNLYDPIAYPGNIIPQIPYFGGKHFIYVMQSRYDEGVADQRLLLDNYDNLNILAAVPQIPKVLRPFYRSLMWTCIPYVTPGYNFTADPGSIDSAYVPPSEVDIRLRVETPFKRMATSATSGIDSLPRYQFSTRGLGVTQNNQPLAKNSLSLIRLVPNPYLGYSALRRRSKR